METRVSTNVHTFRRLGKENFEKRFKRKKKLVLEKEMELSVQKITVDLSFFHDKCAMRKRFLMPSIDHDSFVVI